MKELHKKPEVMDTPKTVSPALQDIKPKSSITLTDAKDFFHSMFEKVEWGGHFVPEEKRKKHIPSEERVDWKNTPGDSLAVPKTDSPKGAEIKTLLDKYGLKGINYKNLEPDFSKCSESTVKIDDMSGKCLKNAPKADAQAAKQWNKEHRGGRSDWKASDVRQYRKENNLTWHERCDMKTMDLIPTAINLYFTHSGGCAECLAKEKLENGQKNGQKVGGNFDD